jgi:hypothetical protein
MDPSVAAETNPSCLGKLMSDPIQTLGYVKNKNAEQHASHALALLALLRRTGLSSVPRGLCCAD